MQSETPSQTPPPGKVSVAVATSSQHVATDLSQKARAGGFAFTAIRPDTAMINALLAKSPATIVMLDSTSSGNTWLSLLSETRNHYPATPFVVLGDTTDLQLVAKAIMAGASHFLLRTTQTDEFVNTVVSVAAGRKPNHESVFGRVAAAIPRSTGSVNLFCNAEGRRMTAEQAIQRCDQFGLSVDEIAVCLGLDRAEVEAITRRSRQAPTLAVTKVGRIALLGCVLAVFGCAYIIGQFLFTEELPRYRLSGTVTFKGRAVPCGTITFRSSKEGEKQAGYAGIIDGKFDTQVDGKGHVGGPHAIAIMGFDHSTEVQSGEQASAAPLFEPIEWEDSLPGRNTVLRVELPRSTR